MKVPFVDLSSQYNDLDPGVFADIIGLIQDCKCIQGDTLKQFEEEFAAYLGVGYAVGVGCGLDALTIAMMCLNIGPGDEVIVPVNTFIARPWPCQGLGPRLCSSTVTRPTIWMSGSLAPRSPQGPRL